MGIRGNNHIKIIKKSMSNNSNTLASEENDVKTLLSFLTLDPNKINKADISSFDQSLLYKDNMLNMEETKKLNRILNNILIACPQRNLYINSLFNILSILEYNTSNGLSSKDTSMYQEYELIDIMIKSGLLIKKDKIYYNTYETDNFIHLFNKIRRIIPFNWDNFIETGYKKEFSPLFSNRNNSNQLLDISGQKYILGTNEYDKNYQVQLASSIFYSLVSSNNNKSTSIQCLTPRKLRLECSERADVLQHIFNSAQHANVEMIPIATNEYFSVLQGTLNNKPVFSRINNKILTYCCNVYGKELQVVLDYEGIEYNTSEDKKQGRLFLLDKNNKIVFSYMVEVQTLDDNSSDKKKYNTYSYNINQFNNI